MRSRHADRFNHDPDAADYDRDVLDEADPIRTGYDALLDWVTQRAELVADSRVLELGSGTGNLSLRLPAFGELVCVDISDEMSRIARDKLSGQEGVRWVGNDLLEYFDSPGPDFDAVLSSYAIHHLLEAEKQQLFGCIARRLRPGGRAVFGDLMFENEDARQKTLRAYRASGRSELADEIEDEFFWDVESASRGLRGLGLEVETRRFSELSWGIGARRSEGGARPTLAR